MRSLSRSLRLAALTALLGAAGSASALNVTYGDVAVRNLDSWGFTATDGQLMTDWNGSSGTDQLYQMYGYIGTASGMVAVNSGSFRTGCGTGSASSLCGSAISQTAANRASSRIVLNQNVGNGATRVARNALTLTYDFTLVNDTTAADLDRLDWSVSFTNNSTGTLSFVFYSYLDLDLLGTPANDLVTVVNGGQRIVVRDATNPTGRPFVWNALTGSAAHFQVGAFPGLQNSLNGMTSAQNLSDTNALAGGPGDVTAAFQYFLTLAPGQTISLTSTVAEPHTAAMVALGLGGLALYSRPRRRTRAKD
jgi:hypothetical protein